MLVLLVERWIGWLGRQLVGSFLLDGWFDGWLVDWLVEGYTKKKNRHSNFFSPPRVPDREGGYQNEEKNYDNNHS